MREIIWDTETTGFDPDSGDRLVEIAAIELQSHLPTERRFHRYINPEREVPSGAFEVHGLSWDFLKAHPVFADVAADFLEFIDGATLIAHNAEFDMKFINAELGWAGLPTLPMSCSLDTLVLAREKFPSQSNSLDALCRRFDIDNSMREKHSALLDCELLAEVYLELIGGRQPDLVLAGGTKPAVAKVAPETAPAVGLKTARTTPLPSRLTEDERTAHQGFIGELGEDPLWNKLGG